MKNYKLLILLNLILISLLSCGSVGESFSSGKKENSDEFLVQKKSPLVMPPNYDELPTPGANETQNVNREDEIKDLIGKNKSSSNSTSTNNDNKSLENSVLDKIKRN
jgi:hypothetical protein|tara:strand:+ start:160 stop:480 length:321 start_codon:yes stop_codon:yes gene_type:complete